MVQGEKEQEKHQNSVSPLFCLPLFHTGSDTTCSSVFIRVPGASLLSLSLFFFPLAANPKGGALEMPL